MLTMHHHHPCEADLEEVPPSLYFRLRAHEAGGFGIRVWEQCETCQATVWYVGNAKVRGAHVIRTFKSGAVTWIATWLTRNTIWGDQPIPGL